MIIVLMMTTMAMKNLMREETSKHDELHIFEGVNHEKVNSRNNLKIRVGELGSVWHNYVYVRVLVRCTCSSNSACQWAYLRTWPPRSVCAFGCGISKFDFWKRLSIGRVAEHRQTQWAVKSIDRTERCNTCVVCMITACRFCNFCCCRKVHAKGGGVCYWAQNNN